MPDAEEASVRLAREALAIAQAHGRRSHTRSMISPECEVRVQAARLHLRAILLLEPEYANVIEALLTTEGLAPDDYGEISTAYDQAGYFAHKLGREYHARWTEAGGGEEDEALHQ